MRDEPVDAGVPAAPDNELARAAAGYARRAAELGADPHTAAAAVLAAWPPDP